MGNTPSQTPNPHEGSTSSDNNNRVSSSQSGLGRSGSQKGRSDRQTPTSTTIGGSSPSFGVNRDNFTNRPQHLPLLPHHRAPSAGTGGLTSPSFAHRVSPSSSAGPTSPASNRPTSPRRRKSLELPDLNRLGLTSVNPAQPGDAPNTSTVTSNAEVGDGNGTGAGNTEGAAQPRSPSGETDTGRLRGAARLSPLGPGIQRPNNLSSALSNSNLFQQTAPMSVPSSPPQTTRSEHNPYFPSAIPINSPRADPPVTPAELPNYSHSPVPERVHSPLRHDSSGDVSPRTGPTIVHTEDISQPGQKNTSSSASHGKHPSPAQPAQPVISEHQAEAGVAPTTPQGQLPPGATQGTGRVGESVVLSGLPKGISPIRNTNPVDGGAKNPSPSLAQPQDTSNNSVPTLVTWAGGGKEVYVTGTFAEGGWRTRLKMDKSTHDFSLMLNLPPGVHRLKFIVDDHWRCSNLMQTATDGDGNLVNWVQVEAPRPKGEIFTDSDWQIAEWARKVNDNSLEEDEVEWTDEIPLSLINFQAMEERALSDPPEDLKGPHLQQWRKQQSALLANVPVPPTLPRHLEKVILNSTPKELEGTVGGAGGDDNSILPVPNHVVLNHLTASAIRNGTLAVGTTTRYKRKYISTIYFKPVESIAY